MKKYNVSKHIHTLKCAAAVILSITLSSLISEDSLSASFVAILCIKPTFYTGLVVGMEQFIASFLGGLITSLLILFFGKSVIVAGIAIILVISLCKAMKWENYFIVASFTVLYMILMPYNNTIIGMEVRMASVFLGILSASLINFLLSFFRYKRFFDYKINFYSSLMFEKFKQVQQANKNVDVELMSKLYIDFENIYLEIGNLSLELNHIEKELRFRKQAGGMNYPKVWYMYRVTENLKMCVRYLQDISFVSKTLAPVHTQIPQDWKDQVDSYWKLAEYRYKKVLDIISNPDSEIYEIENTYNSELIKQISEKIKTCDEESKNIYAQVLAIVSDFQQFDMALNNFIFSIIKYKNHLKEIK